MSDYVKALEAARAAAVKQRRDWVSDMTTYHRGKTEQATAAFLNLHSLIKAIDEAIDDERRQASEKLSPNI
jgi:hypothetical protein